MIHKRIEKLDLIVVRKKRYLNISQNSLFPDTPTHTKTSEKILIIMGRWIRKHIVSEPQKRIVKDILYEQLKLFSYRKRIALFRG